MNVNFSVLRSELVSERNRIDEQLEHLDALLKLRGEAVVAVKPVKAKAARLNNDDKDKKDDKVEGEQPQKRRGRPPGSKSKPKEEGAADDGKGYGLPALLEQIATQVDKPLTLADFVKLALETGYTSKAVDFSNMVYQSLRKMTEKGVFEKSRIENGDKHMIVYVKKAA